MRTRACLQVISVKIGSARTATTQYNAR